MLSLCWVPSIAGCPRGLLTHAPAHRRVVLGVVFDGDGARAAAEEEEAETSPLNNGPKPRCAQRRGSWHPKPRQGWMYGHDPSTGAAKDEWEHDPKQSAWAKFFPDGGMEVPESDNDEDEDEEQPHTWLEAQFRREFHVSRRLFYYHLAALRRSGEFDEKLPGDGTRGRRSHPLHLKLAFSFVRLTEGISYHRGETLACICEQQLRSFHHQLLSFWRLNLYAKHVYPPRSLAEAKVSEAKYSKMGFPGAVSSYDGVPIRYPRCPAGATGQHTGKEGYPTRRFMVGVDADGCVIDIGNGSHQGTRNDLTMSTLSDVLVQLRDGKLFPEMTFLLIDEQGETKVLRGIYAVTDGGFP